MHWFLVVVCVIFQFFISFFLANGYITVHALFENKEMCGSTACCERPSRKIRRCVTGLSTVNVPFKKRWEIICSTYTC